MSGQTCIDAVAALAHLAVADPYTAVEASGALPPEPCHLPAATAVSATNPPTTLMQASNPVQLSPQQSTASALHLLQQLLASPSKSNDSASDGEVNSKAVSVCQASGLHSWSETLRPVLTTPAETASGLGEPSTRQARDLPADTLAALPPTAAGAQQEVLDWTIIDDFCSRTVPRSRLRLLLHAWQDVARSHTKWRCIQQVCFCYLLLHLSTQPVLSPTKSLLASADCIHMA